MTNRGASKEAIALEKAAYFAEQELWSDFLQVMFAVENPSPALAKFHDQISEQLCEYP